MDKVKCCFIMTKEKMVLDSSNCILKFSFLLQIAEIGKLKMITGFLSYNSSCKFQKIFV